MKPEEVIAFAKERGVRMVDLNFTVPLHQLTPQVFEEGLNFDGSSIRGWRAINESDMTVMPDPRTAKIDPFMEVPTLSLICDVVHPDTHEPYERDQIGRA